MWVRGLKPKRLNKHCYVTKSHPMWVRGLKHTINHPLTLCRASHPMWVRGLKHVDADKPFRLLAVAPHVGAWIETQATIDTMTSEKVAPHVGAWIETN